MLTLETKPGCSLLLVEVPEGASSFMVHSPLRNSAKAVSTDVSYLLNKNVHFIELFPPGSYKFTATTEMLTEEQVKPLLLTNNCGISWYDYVKDDNKSCPFLNPIESLRSCIIAAGGNEKKQYAILKQL